MGVLGVFKWWEGGCASGLGDDGQFARVLFDLFGALLLAFL
jgi:hypothetical protein